MKVKIIIFLFYFFSNFAFGEDIIVSFSGSKIKLPRDFHELSKDELEIFKSTFFDREIMTIFEKKDKLSGIQRIIIYYDSLSEIKNFSFKQNVEIKLEIIKESGIAFENINIDELKHFVYGQTIIKGDTSFFGFSIDGYGMMGIQFDNSNGIKNADKENFEKLIKSIRHNSPFYFIPKENPETQKAKKEMKSNGMFLAYAFFAMVFIWILRKYVFKMK